MVFFPLKKKVYSSIVRKLLRAYEYNRAEKNNTGVYPQGHHYPFGEMGYTSRISKANNQVPHGIGMSLKQSETRER